MVRGMSKHVEQHRGEADASVARSVRRENALIELRRFCADHGHARVPRRWVTDSGFNLGNWVDRNRRRYRSGSMPRYQVEQLEQIPGWAWNPRDSWDEGISELRRFVDRYGHARVPTGWESSSGFPLGQWAAHRRRYHRRGKLSPQRVAEIESLPRWTWNALDSRWDDVINEIRAFVEEHWHACVPRSHTLPNGYRLGERVAQLREMHRVGKLAEERVKQLEEFPGWVWDSADTWWPAGYAEMLQYVAEHGHAKVPERWKSPRGFALGRWVTEFRRDYREGKLPRAAITELEAVPGWSWGGHDDRWRAGLAALREYTDGHGSACPPHRWVTDDGFRLGAWVATRRLDFRQGRLAENKVRLLSSLPGWSWGQATTSSAA
ncbi:hypothetical protein B8W67_19895 [Mycolicibacillus koreensis]|uniref:Helicase-associated domain-containing protein n=2 Tax=Mycolicibacillus koreensis TaxID=1069220 RepID=A0AA91PA67_9MYCO|nr:hypothetical protein B8W67_19895 [Mycolicibacillus koreensis]